jgi:hypothetical protein
MAGLDPSAGGRGKTEFSASAPASARRHESRHRIALNMRASHGVRLIDSPCPRSQARRRHLRFRFERFQWLAAPFWIARVVREAKETGGRGGHFVFGLRPGKISEKQNERFAMRDETHPGAQVIGIVVGADQSCSGLVCFQWVDRRFISRFFTYRSRIDHDKREAGLMGFLKNNQVPAGLARNCRFFLIDRPGSRPGPFAAPRERRAISSTESRITTLPLAGRYEAAPPTTCRRSGPGFDAVDFRAAKKLPLFSLRICRKMLEFGASFSRLSTNSLSASRGFRLRRTARTQWLDLRRLGQIVRPARGNGCAPPFLSSGRFQSRPRQRPKNRRFGVHPGILSGTALLGISPDAKPTFDS